MKLLVVGLILALNVGFSVCDILPLLQPVLCSRNSQNISACFLQAMQAVLPQVISGNYGNGVTGITLDPYRFELDVSDPDGFQVTVRDGYITNVAGLQIARLRVSLSKRIACVNVKLPQLEIHGQYTLKMKIGDLLDINGAGTFHAADDPTLKIVFPIVVDQNNLNAVKVKLIFDHPSLNLTGVFPGNPAMDAFANTLINQNPFVILDRLTPALQAQIQNGLSTVVDTLIQGDTFDQLFPM